MVGKYGRRVVLCIAVLGSAALSTGCLTTKLWEPDVSPLPSEVTHTFRVESAWLWEDQDRDGSIAAVEVEAHGDSVGALPPLLSRTFPGERGWVLIEVPRDHSYAKSWVAPFAPGDVWGVQVGPLDPNDASGARASITLEREAGSAEDMRPLSESFPASARGELDRPTDAFDIRRSFPGSDVSVVETVYSDPEYEVWPTVGRVVLTPATVVIDSVIGVTGFVIVFVAKSLTNDDEDEEEEARRGL